MSTILIWAVIILISILVIRLGLLALLTIDQKLEEIDDSTDVNLARWIMAAVLFVSMLIGSIF